MTTQIKAESRNGVGRCFKNMTPKQRHFPVIFFLPLPPLGVQKHLHGAPTKGPAPQKTRGNGPFFPDSSDLSISYTKKYLGACKHLEVRGQGSTYPPNAIFFFSWRPLVVLFDIWHLAVWAWACWS
jgi:hypothetical protein